MSIADLLNGIAPTPWDPSVSSSKRLITTAKRHLGDPSLTAAMLQMSPDRMLADPEVGRIWRSHIRADEAGLHPLTSQRGLVELAQPLPGGQVRWIHLYQVILLSG